MAKCLPTYLPLMYQLRMLPPSQQVEVVMLVASQPVLMGAIAIAAPTTHQAVHNIAVVPKLEDLIKVCVHFAAWMLHTRTRMHTSQHGVVIQNTSIVTTVQAASCARRLPVVLKQGLWRCSCPHVAVCAMLLETLQLVSMANVMSHGCWYFGCFVHRILY